MNILLSTDNNYVMPTGVLMTSIGRTNGSDVSYHILTDNAFSEESRDALRNIACKYGNEIFFYVISSEMTKDFPFGRADQPTHVSIATYYRLFITRVLPADVDKIIYLDGDIIVRGSLAPLWATDIDGYAMGTVHDMHEKYHIQTGRLPYNMQDDGYFNAGVLLVNVKYWRENNCIDTFMSIVQQNQDRLKLHDQDVLNIAFHDKKKWLSVTYNMQNGFLLKFQDKSSFPGISGEIDIMKHNPVIVHFCAQDKPWKLECFHPYCKDWRRNFFLTQWRNDKLEDEEDNPTLKRRLRNWLVRHCLYVPATLYQKV